MKNYLKLILAVCLATPLLGEGMETRPRLEILRNSSGHPVCYGGQLSAEPVVLPAAYQPKTAELRGVWVASIDNLDFGSHRDMASFQQEYTELLNNLQRAHLNTVFFQIRPQNDAFYRSRLNPWSKFLSGTEGHGLGNFDPLTYMITETHKRGMQFHAWLNPYRVTKNAECSKSAYLNTLAPTNFARLNPGMVLDVYKGGKRVLMLDPGEPQVVAFLVNTVREIIVNYDVDGIHFDDYFYPYGGCGNVDYRSFSRNNPRHLPLEAWRVENVNSLVWGVSKAIEAHNRTARHKIQFGISPFGIWRNIKNDRGGSLTAGTASFDNQYADTRHWVKAGWVDYIIPQVYWPFEHETAAYAAVTDWWVKTVRGTRVNLYIGHIPGYYGTGRWQNPREIPNQLRYNLKYPEIKGEVMFSYRSLFRPDNFIMHKGSDLILRGCWAEYASPENAGTGTAGTGGKKGSTVRGAVTTASAAVVTGHRKIY